MKRILYCMIIFVLFTGLGWGFELTPGNVSGSPGESLVVPIRISNITGELAVDAFGITIGFDSGVLSFDRADKTGTFTESFDLVQGVSLDESTAKINGVKWGDPLLLNSDAVFVNLVFTIKENADRNSELVLSNIKDDIKSATVRSGMLTVTVNTDTDNDGIPDSWETEHFGDLSHDGIADSDNDSVSDLEEYQNNTNPMQNSDTDNDGMPDDWETAHGLDPNQSADAFADSDGDGVSNAEEFAKGTDPQKKDYYFISGTVNYAGEESGYLYVKAFRSSDTAFAEPVNGFSEWWEVSAGSMTYSIPVPDGTYILKAFIDSNENETADSAEAQGKYETGITVSGADDAVSRDVTLTVTESPVFTGVKIYAGDADAQDWFGHFRQSVAIEGDYAVVGAPEYNSTEEKGGAYVYQRNGNQWVQIAKLSAGDGVAGDNFGHSVDISGDQVLVGRFITDQSSGYNVRKGEAYIFQKPADGWKDMTETAVLRFTDASTPNPYTNNFGRSVALSGNYAVVAAYWDCNGAYKSGAVYVYEKPAGGWADMTETAMLKPDAPDYREGMGTSVDIDGDTIIAGGAGYGNNAGAVRVFQRNNGTWTHTQTLQASDTADYHNFGDSVKIYGDSLIAGADHMYPAAESDGRGAAYIFRKINGVWTQKAKLTSSDLEEDDLFGFSVGISNGIAAVGAWGDDDKATTSGAVYYFEMPSEGWTDMTETAKIVPDDGQRGARFGFSVSVSDIHLIASAPLDDDKATDAGAAYIFRLSDEPEGGLTAYYPFNGNVTDESGNGHDGILSAGVFKEGQCGGSSLDFSGEGRNNVLLPGVTSDYLSEESFTVSMWINSTGMKNFNYLIHFNDDRPGIRLNDENRILFSFKSSWNTEPLANQASAGLLSENAIPLNVWTHVACKWDGSTFSGYVNGNLTGQIELPYFILGRNVHIGSDGGDVRDFEGMMDEVRLYNRALTEAEIQELSKPCEQTVPNNTVTIVPLATVVKTGETFETEIRVKGENIWAAHAEIKTDPEVLNPKDEGKYGDVFSKSQRFEIPPSYDTESGVWIGVMSLRTPAEPFSGEGLFAKLKYTVLPGIYGETRISGQVMLTDRNGEMLPVQVSDAVITVDDGIHGGDGVIQGTVTLPDGTPVAGADVTVSIDGKEYTVTTDENGHYVFEDLRDLNPGESFTVTVSKDGFSVTQTVDSVENPVTLDMEILDTALADLNKDTIVDIADFTLLANSYGLSEGNEGYDSRADINGDKTVNIQDLALLGSHWKIK